MAKIILERPLHKVIVRNPFKNHYAILQEMLSKNCTLFSVFAENFGKKDAQEFGPKYSYSSII